MTDTKRDTCTDADRAREGSVMEWKSDAELVESLRGRLVDESLSPSYTGVGRADITLNELATRLAESRAEVADYKAALNARLTAGNCEECCGDGSPETTDEEDARWEAS